MVYIRAFYRRGNRNSRQAAYLSVLLWLVPLVLMAQASPEDAPATTQPAQDAVLLSTGAGLFKENCKVCHQINEKLIGPALRDVHKRRPVSWIKAFITNTQKVIKSGDPYAVELYNAYNQTQMTAFDFTDEELGAIVAYLRAESEKALPVTTAPSADDVGAAAEKTVSSADTQLLWQLVTVVLLLLLLCVLVVYIPLLKRYALKIPNLTEEERASLSTTRLKSILSNRILWGVIIFFLVIVGVKSGIDGLFGIGIQQGYAPQQPIAFSHKIHAGKYQIDCNYCHTGVYKSKFANIPSVNICMNCHGEIKKESPEIQKLYTAQAQGRPIEWVRVHNLPDLAYFSHVQHVQVGNIPCATCHGDIAAMDVVHQYAELTMGWCINCHQETQVQAENNPYYDKLMKIHNKKPLRVEDIGGLECSKCHY